MTHHTTATSDRQKEACIKSDDEVLTLARRSIDLHRKTEVCLSLRSQNGAPLPGISVQLQPKRHAFVFGCSSGGVLEEEQNPARRERNRLFAELFNGTHAKCYWDENWHWPIEKRQGVRDTTRFLAEIDWACANGLAVRGHPLVWTTTKAIPAWVRNYPYAQQVQFMEHHVRSLIQCARGRVQLWDIVNEMLWEPSLRHLPERDWPHLESVDEILTYVEPAIHWAREEDPGATYVLNDYGLERTATHSKGITAAHQRQRMVALVQALRARGAAPHAIGTQAHVGQWYPMKLVWQVFNDLAQAAVPIHVTEFWAKEQDCPNAEHKTPEQIREEREEYLRNYYTVAFGHPSVQHLSYWGDIFFDKGGWQPSSAYRTLYDLIHNEWMSRGAWISDATGTVRGHIFYGDYALTWQDALGNSYSRPLRVEPGRDTHVIVELDTPA